MSSRKCIKSVVSSTKIAEEVLGVEWVTVWACKDTLNSLEYI